MDFFDKIGKTAAEAYKITADKTGKIAKETKLKMKMNELKSEVNNIYKEIGKKVYEKHIIKEDISIKKDLKEECEKIDVLSEEIEEILTECLKLKDKKQCPACHKEIDKEYQYCPNCGKKQKEIKEEKPNDKKAKALTKVENQTNNKKTNSKNDTKQEKKAENKKTNNTKKDEKEEKVYKPEVLDKNANKIK